MILELCVSSRKIDDKKRCTEVSGLKQSLRTRSTERMRAAEQWARSANRPDVG